MDLWILAYLHYAAFISLTSSQLIVNVKNKGDEVLQENIQANITQDTIILEFLKSDGTEIIQFIDMKNEIQVFRATVLGEEELGQRGYQVMCFVVRFVKNDFISTDAMSKLRQKNPSAIRHPEEDKEEEVISNDMMMDVDRAHVLSPYIPGLCHEAKQSTYAREADLKMLSHSMLREPHPLMGHSQVVEMENQSTCRTVMDPKRSCLCQYQMCIGWYPCGLKYCHGKDSSGKVVNYRCGIKTCQKCRTFDYLVNERLSCMWDLPESSYSATN